MSSKEESASRWLGKRLVEAKGAYISASVLTMLSAGCFVYLHGMYLILRPFGLLPDNSFHINFCWDLFFLQADMCWRISHHSPITRQVTGL